MHRRSIFRIPRPSLSAGRRIASIGVATALVLVGSAVSTEPAIAAEAVKTTYYVACKSGKAGGTGTAAKPWTSLGQVSGHGAFQPGDRVLIKRGTTCTGSVTLHGSGTAGAPILLGAYGSGAKPTLAGRGTRNGTGVVRLRNLAWWTVQDLHITNTTGRWNPKTVRAGVLITSTNSRRQAGIVVQRLTLDKIDSNPGGAVARSYGGIVALTSKKAAGFDGMVIRANRLNGVGRSGIAIVNAAYPFSSDRGVRVTGNSLRWIRGDGIILSGVDGGRIDHNVSAYGSNISKCSVKQCGRMGGPTTANAAIWPTLSSDIRIDHNEVYGEHPEAGDGSGIDVDLGAHRILIEQNYLHDNGRGGIMFCGGQDTVVRFNVLEHNKQSAIWWTCGWQKDQRPKNITITNNDIVVDRSAQWVIRNVHPFAGKNIRFTNNLVSCTGSCIYSWPNKPVAASNTFAGTRSKTEPKGTGTKHGALGLRAPGTGRTGFHSLSGYHLKKKATAPRGVPLSSPADDIFGKPVDSKRPFRGAASS